MALSCTSSDCEWECGPLFADDDPGSLVDVIAAPPLLSTGGPTTFSFGPDVVTLILPPSDSARGGLGTRVWRGSLVCARALMNQAARIKDAKVIELGAGTGLCGLLAACLGAREVVLTDCSYESLKQLLPSVLYNSCGGERGIGHAQWGCLGDQLRIQRHLWENDIPRSPGRPLPQHFSNSQTCVWGSEGVTPELHADAVFDIVIGSDVLYFGPQVEALLATLSMRLVATGIAVLTITVRRRPVYERFLLGLSQVGLVLLSEQAVAVDELDRQHLEKGAVEETSNASGEIRLVLLVKA